MKHKVIRLGDMIKWWTRNNEGNFNVDLYLRIVYVKSLEYGNQTVEV
jgi:hypothetical protein